MYTRYGVSIVLHIGNFALGHISLNGMSVRKKKMYAILVTYEGFVLYDTQIPQSC